MIVIRFFGRGDSREIYWGFEDAQTNSDELFEVPIAESFQRQQLKFPNAGKTKNSFILLETKSRL